MMTKTLDNPRCFRFKASTKLGLCLMGFALFACTDRDVLAQQPTLTGNWYHEGQRVEQNQRNAVVEKATQNMPRFVRGRAREQLQNATNPASQMMVADAGNQVTLTSNGKSVSLTIDGRPVDVSEGQRAGQMRATRQNGNLIVEGKSDAATRRVTYRLSEDGQRLTLGVDMMIHKLGQTLRYESTYVRR